MLVVFGGLRYGAKVSTAGSSSTGLGGGSIQEGVEGCFSEGRKW
jgi:hypothetical protein